MVKHAVFQLQFVLPAVFAEVDIKHRFSMAGFHAIDMDGQIIEEHFRRHGAYGIRAGGVRRRQFLYAVTQLLGAGEVEVTPRTGFGLIAQLLQGIRFQVFRLLVFRVGKDHFAGDLSDPAVVTLAVIVLGLFQHLIRAAHVFDKLLRRLLWRQFVKGCRVAIEPAEIEHVGGFHIMTYRTIVAAACPLFFQRWRQLKVSGDFITGQPFVGHAQSLVIDITIHIALTFHQLNDVVVTPGRPVVLGNNDFGIVAPTFDGGIDIFRPGQRIANFCAAQRIGIVQRVGHVFRGFDHFLLFDVPQHF
ncbi:Uncharacterised protein [Raoultella ornithinolytica]|nr:Uncharacterised protein [Raoultella ornithinolytica]